MNRKEEMEALADRVNRLRNEPYAEKISDGFLDEIAAALRASAAPEEGTVDALRKTVADEWGSHVCWRDSITGTRVCDNDKHCRCADIARAIISTHALPSDSGKAAPVACEPVAHYESRDCYHIQACPHYVAVILRAQQAEQKLAALAPATEGGGREEIARRLFDHWKVKNPTFDYVEWGTWYRDHWITYADAILSPPPPSPSMGSNDKT